MSLFGATTSVIEHFYYITVSCRLWMRRDQFGEFLVRIALCLDPAQLQLLSSPVPSAEDSPCVDTVYAFPCILCSFIWVEQAVRVVSALHSFGRVRHAGGKGATAGARANRVLRIRSHPAVCATAPTQRLRVCAVSLSSIILRAFSLSLRHCYHCHTVF